MRRCHRRPFMHGAHHASLCTDLHEGSSGGRRVGRSRLRAGALGGQLSLFAMVSNDASSVQAAAKAASATTVVQRDGRGGKRS